VRALGERPWNSPELSVGNHAQEPHLDITLPQGGSLTVKCPDRSGYIVITGAFSAARAVVPIRGPSVAFHGLATGSYSVKVWNGGCVFEVGPICEVVEGRAAEVSIPNRR
jgi:hypothetical protein